MPYYLAAITTNLLVCHVVKMIRGWLVIGVEYTTNPFAAKNLALPESENVNQTRKSIGASTSMAGVASNSITLVHRFHLPQSPSRPIKSFLISSFKRSRRFTAVACQITPETTETSNQAVPEVGSSGDSEFPEFPNKSVNKQIAVISVIAALGLFFSSRLDFGVSLKDLSAAAMPYEEALSNGKPTVVEFYADWCEVCRELAPDIYKIEQQYNQTRDRVNFVMLNVDNTKWEQELDEFGVEGIPHFAFLDMKGNEEGNVVGRLPKQYFLENVDALARGEASVPHARAVGQYTSAESRKVHQVVDPRSHG